MVMVLDDGSRGKCIRNNRDEDSQRKEAKQRSENVNNEMESRRESLEHLRKHRSMSEENIEGSKGCVAAEEEAPRHSGQNLLISPWRTLG